jgi:hypothetical protein
MSTRAQQEEEAKEKARQAKLRRRRAKQAAENAKQEAREEAEKKRAFERAQNRWVDCLQCLQESVPLLRANPWLIIHEPPFIHDYLDSLTETLANLSKHESDLDTVRKVLQEVYEAFVDIGKFATLQPGFYITDPHTIKRFVRLLEQVAHKGSDKALFPNVLSLLGPTFAREEMAKLLSETRIITSLLAFCRSPNHWIPTKNTLALLIRIYDHLSRSVRLQAMFMDNPGWERLVNLGWGKIEGLTDQQQKAVQHALRRFPAPEFEDEDNAEGGQ